MTSISIFGLGYVGTVTAACLASRGHRVIGVDPNPLKVQRIQAGESPMVEADIQEMIALASRSGLISATEDPAVAIANSEISFISVGTPGRRNGKPDLSHVLKVCEDLGSSLKTKTSFHWIVVRSTLLPGTTESVVIPAIETASGRKAGRDFAVCFNPEFLREGTAVSDFFNPPYTIIGTNDRLQADAVCELYNFIAAPLHLTSMAEAEMIKYSSNAFHGLKVAFANEIGTVCAAVGVDAKTVASIFKSDTQLNVSSAYLTPGFAFGGSCLPKDIRALTHRARELDLRLPLLESILSSNVEHIDRAVELILSLAKRRIGIVGLSFKQGTDDLRESPMVNLVKKLIAEGCDIQIWDEDVSIGQLIGSNRDFIKAHIPHIGTLLAGSIESVVAHGEIIVLGTNAVAQDELLKRLRCDQCMVDVAHLERPSFGTALLPASSDRNES